MRHSQESIPHGRWVVLYSPLILTRITTRQLQQSVLHHDTPRQGIANSVRCHLHKTLGDFQLYSARPLTSPTHHLHLPPPFTQTFYIPCSSLSYIFWTHCSNSCTVVQSFWPKRWGSRENGTNVGFPTSQPPLQKRNRASGKEVHRISGYTDITINP